MTNQRTSENILRATSPADVVLNKVNALGEIILNFISKNGTRVP